MEMMFLLIGLGFFLYVIYLIERSDERRYDQKMEYIREFGHPPQSLVQKLIGRK